MLSDEYFSILNKSNNGSYFYVKANVVGKTVMIAKLLGIQVSFLLLLNFDCYIPPVVH